MFRRSEIPPQVYIVLSSPCLISCVFFMSNPSKKLKINRLQKKKWVNMEWPPKNLITFLLGSHHASWMYHPGSPSEPSPRKRMLKFRDLFKSGVIITEKSQWFVCFYSKMIALLFFFTNRKKTSLDPWFTTKMQVVARRLASLLKKSWGGIAWHCSNR